MANNYDNRYDGNGLPRRPYDDLDRPSEERGERPPMDRPAYQSRRPYPDRDPYADRGYYSERAPHREEEPAFDPMSQASGVTITPGLIVLIRALRSFQLVAAAFIACR